MLRQWWVRRKVDGWSWATWIVQVLLAAVFFRAGLMKATWPTEALVGQGWGWVPATPAGFITVLGIMELLGAIGIILPAATRILPWMTQIAASGMAFVQVSAIALHAARDEGIGSNLVLLAMALFVMWGRSRGRLAPSK